MLELKNICYRYKGSDGDVLKNISAEFHAGYFYSIVGSSGVGKTTLLSIMAGLDKPTSGDLFFNDKNLSGMDLNQYRLKDISMVFQYFHLFPLLTTLENTGFVLETSGVKRKEAEIKSKKLLDMVGIDESKYKRYPSNLSGGEQQRVAIARSLSTGAKLILADEPTGNLDMANGRAIVKLLQHLAHNDLYCVITVTHNLEIANVSDTVFQMADGMISKRNGLISPAENS